MSHDLPPLKTVVREEMGLQIECLADMNQAIDELFEFLQDTGREGELDRLSPYFGVIWPSARALAQSLFSLKPFTLKDRRVLEVGCGLALPSLVAERLGAQVVATDFHPLVPGLLRANMERNSISNIRYVEVDWTSSLPDPGSYDWVIASDVLYEAHHPPIVARTLLSAIKPGGTIVLADPARPYLQAFADEMRALGREPRTEVRTVADGALNKDVFVLTFKA